MIKKEIYPKTKRVSCSGDKVYITEKLDGSNLVIFKKNEELYIAQRNNIFKIDELEEAKGILYKGLYQWLLDNKDTLINELHNNSAICGEWLGMGCLKYNSDKFDKKWYMFAKANIDDELSLYNLIYEHDLFIYPFVSKKIPNFIGIVPEITTSDFIPTKKDLDNLYEKYSDIVNRKVEGFVINYKNIITKYVRMKNGKISEHFDREGE